MSLKTAMAVGILSLLGGTAMGSGADVVGAALGFREGPRHARELHSRVWQLESSMQELRARLVDVEQRCSAPPPVFHHPFTCVLRTPFKVFTATAPTQGQAYAEVLERCSHHGSLCRENEVRCQQ